MYSFNYSFQKFQKKYRNWIITYDATPHAHTRTRTKKLYLLIACERNANTIEKITINLKKQKFDFGYKYRMQTQKRTILRTPFFYTGLDRAGNII